MGLVARCGAVLVLPLLLCACATAVTGGEGPGDSLAALSVIDTRADVRPLTAEVFAEAEDAQPLDVGDTVRTNASGFAEVQYADGSLTRLGAATVLQVVALDGDVTVPEIEVDLDVGRVWNRVNTVTGERGRFEVGTDVGTAAVRGTAFAIECTDEPVCTFTVTEGRIVVTTLDGTVIEIGAGEVVTLGRDASDTTGGTTGDGGGDSDGGGDGGDGGDGDGTGGDGEDGDGAGTRIVELSRTPVGDGTDTDSSVWLARNEPLDRGTGRFSTPDQHCSVTVGGRNLDRATTPETAIEASIDQALQVDAVATGPLDRYQVDLHLAGLSLRAAEGEVQADDSGDRTTFRGEVDVSEYATWGVGLYEVTARTTGTECLAHAFINVTGRSPLTTGGGGLAVLLTLLGTGGLLAAFSLATSVGTPTAAATGEAATTDEPGGDSPAVEDGATTSSWFKGFLDFFGGG